MKTFIIVFVMIALNSRSQEPCKFITPTTFAITAKKQYTIETPDRQLMQHLNSPRWFMSKTGIYRVSFKLKDSVSIINKIKKFYKIKEVANGK